MPRKKFLRRIWWRHSRLGRKRKKKQKWRKPKGRDNKMREKKKGHSAVVEIGYKKSKNQQGKINGKERIIIKNIKDLEKIKGYKSIILGKIGKKKKIEIAKKAKEKKINISNLNITKFLKKIQKQEKKKKQKEEKSQTSKKKEEKTSKEKEKK